MQKFKNKILNIKRGFKKNQISNQIKYRFWKKIKYQIKSNIDFEKKSNIKSNQISILKKNQISNQIKYQNFEFFRTLATYH